MSGLSARGHGFVWGSVAVIALALLWVTQAAKEQNVWGGWRESGELRRPAYRERIYEREVWVGAFCHARSFCGKAIRRGCAR